MAEKNLKNKEVKKKKAEKVVADPTTGLAKPVKKPKRHIKVISKWDMGL